MLERKTMNCETVYRHFFATQIVWLQWVKRSSSSFTHPSQTKIDTYSLIVKKINASQYENLEYVSLFWCHFLPVFLFPNSMYVCEYVCVRMGRCVCVCVCVFPPQSSSYIYACHFVPIGFSRFYLPWGSSCSRQQSWQVHGNRLHSFFSFFLFPVCRNGKTKKVNN